MIPYHGNLSKSLGRASAMAALSAVALALPTAPLPLVALPGNAPAGDWYVDASNPNCPGSGAPGDPFCAIQDGIDAATSGDTVHVAPGTYVENIDFLGKAITVRGTAGSAVTIIDGNQADWVVTFQSGETSSSVLDGFTVTNGPGGVLCDSSSPTIANSTITGNRNTSNQYFGYSSGGISCSHSSATITHSIISGNEATFCGGGVSCGYSALTITDSVVQGNYAVGGYGFFGEHYPGEGGGFYSAYSSLTISHTTVGENGAILGGGIRDFRSRLTITDTILHGNAASYGGGIYTWDPEAVSISHTTIGGNSAYRGGGIYSRSNPANVPTITHSVLWANVPNETDGPVTVAYTDIAGGWTGTGNIDADPLFVDAAKGDYRLGPGSPCIDGGDPAAAPTGADLGDNPRFLDGDLDRVQVTDMGAYEFSHVHLDVAGTAVPGGTLTLTTSGTPGMFAFLILGLRPGDVSLGRYGTLFIDPPWTFRAMGVIPEVSTLTLPASNLPPTVYLQELAVSFRKRAGTTGNLVELRVQ